MERSLCDEPGWYHALTLIERLASLREAPAGRSGDARDAERARQRRERWRAQPPFAQGSAFARRLASDDLTLDDLDHLLGEPVEAVRDRCHAPPAWLVQLDQAFASSSFDEPIRLPESLSGQAMAGILDGIRPLISQGLARLRQGIREIARTRSELPFDPDAIESVLFARLPARLVRLMSRTMVLELNVARLRGLLRGDTPEERFQSFVQRLRDRDAVLAILQEYPALARQLVLHVDQWVATSLELLQRLCADWDEIRAVFQPGQDPGMLVQLDGEAGDQHRNGRSVLIARFGSGFQVVYKPRSLAVDAHFQELLAWIDERGEHPRFRTLRVLDRGAYGWVEFVARQGCTSVAEVQRFYERLGGYLALLYTLGATDFHLENLIAAGEHPMLIDLESLFHPRFGGRDAHHAEELAGRMLVDSVLDIGLLPLPRWTSGDEEGADTSGLGGASGQLTSHAVPQWENAGTDAMRMVRKRAVMEGAQNRPTLDGAEVHALDHVASLAAGFTAIYRLLHDHREELLAADGPIARFAADEVRVILRPTQTYARLLAESFHPDVLRDALDRDRLLDRLWGWVEQFPFMARAIPGERTDLQNGDIPLFTARPGARDLWSSAGERIPDFLDEPGLELTRRRTQRLSEADLDRQLWIMRASLTTLSQEVERPVRRSVRRPARRSVPEDEPRTAASRERLLAAARKVGDQLLALAYRGDGDAAWVGLNLGNARQWTLRPLAADLYDGHAGCALFLAYLGAVAGDERYTALARAAVTTLCRQLEDEQTRPRWIGGFSGLGGIVHTLAHLGALWNEPALLARAEAIVARLPALIERDERLDVIAGAAGCIGGLLGLYRCAPSEPALAALLLCGDRLLATARSMPRGIGWLTLGPTPLAGFSHGGAGIALALLELAAVSGAERFHAAALGAIEYERSLFRSEAGNWLDLRPAESPEQTNAAQDRFMTAWCNGAPGIGLARLHGLRHLDDAAARAEIAAALETTLAAGFGRNHSLCHGDLGNLETLLVASQVLDDPRWPAQVNRLAAMLLESIEQEGWLCANPLGVETPGLMTGLAGIGYELLRVAEPGRVPSVLLLEPPRAG